MKWSGIFVPGMANGPAGVSIADVIVTCGIVKFRIASQDGAPHNVAIYTDSTSASPISVGQIVTSAKADQVVPALKAGTYFFRCDVHHDMTGTIVAK